MVAGQIVGEEIAGTHRYVVVILVVRSPPNLLLRVYEGKVRALGIGNKHR